MQQTFLSMVALLIAMLLSLNQKQATLQSQQLTVRAELEQMAVGVAMQTMEIVRARAYDAATMGIPSDSTVDKSNFSSTPFTKDRACKVFGGNDTCDDVDDFHEMQPATVPFSLADSQFDFTVEVRVRYVNANLNPNGGTKSYRKEVTVFVQDDPSNGEPRLVEPIEYSEVIAYP